MIYFIMLILIPLCVAIVVSYFFADKKFLVGKEPEDVTSEIEAINRQISCYVNGLYTPLKNYTIQVTVQDGKVQKVATETTLSESSLVVDEKTNESEVIKRNKGCSLVAARIMMGVYIFTITFLFCLLLLALL